MPDAQHAVVAKGLAAMHHAGSGVEARVAKKATRVLHTGYMRHMGYRPGK